MPPADHLLLPRPALRRAGVSTELARLITRAVSSAEAVVTAVEEVIQREKRDHGTRAVDERPTPSSR